jgi:hypothetical protein
MMPVAMPEPAVRSRVRACSATVWSRAVLTALSASRLNGPGRCRSRAGAVTGSAATSLRTSNRALEAASVASARVMTSSRAAASSAAPVPPSLRAATL